MLDESNTKNESLQEKVNKLKSIVDKFILNF